MTETTMTIETDLDFHEFASIELVSQNVTITEKIHGTNAQILIWEHACDVRCGGPDDTFGQTNVHVRAGSRQRWLTPEDDNYAFARWVSERKSELIAKLGIGRHYGEWYGSGINAGYGMKEKRFALFNARRWNAARDAGELPAGVDVVPTLYSGPFTSTVIDETMAKLKETGSVIAPGFMKPEGIVIHFDRSRVMMKRTFESEDKAWYHAEKVRQPRADQAEIEARCAPFWQPIRLEKLLSRDEAFGRDYPTSLPNLVSAYVHDLFKETEGVDEETQKIVKKHAFKAIKGMMTEKGYSA